MKNFFIITNAYKDKEFSLTKKLQQYICEHGGASQYMESQQVDDPPETSFVDIPPGTECVLVLGGDGTLIRAARNISEYGIPMIGINLGHLGYLCELEEKNVFQAMNQIMEDHYIVEERMMIQGLGVISGKRMNHQSALNDIVMFRAGNLQIVEMIVYVNGEFLNMYRGDGIIVSTPTGSTGYSMSAGGPIVDPKAKMIVLTPINAHNLNSKSIILSADDTITIELGSRRKDKSEKVEVSFDGDQAVTLNVGDKIEISTSKQKTKILKLSKISFLEILRKKMQIYS